MVGSILAAKAVREVLATGDSRALKLERKSLMKSHGNASCVLGMMQRYWYTTDNRRERFVAICKDIDVQKPHVRCLYDQTLGPCAIDGSLTHLLQ